MAGTATTHDWYVSIMSNRTHRLYVGCTNDLIRRCREHIEKKNAIAFTAR